MFHVGYLYYIDILFQAFASNRSSLFEASSESSLRKAEHTKPDTVKQEIKYFTFPNEYLCK